MDFHDIRFLGSIVRHFIIKSIESLLIDIFGGNTGGPLFIFLST
jgi:hypothetical protein